MGQCQGSCKQRQLHSNKYSPYMTRKNKVDKTSAEEVKKNQEKNLKAVGRRKSEKIKAEIRN